MFLTYNIMALENINCLDNTKEALFSIAWENIVSDDGSDTV